MARAGVLAGVVMLAACASAAPGRSRIGPADPAAWERLVAAEDARVTTQEDRAVVQAALESEDEVLRAMAVRALGRSERAEFAELIEPLLHDPADAVRAAAAHALGDVSRDTASAFRSRTVLLDALPQSAGYDAAAAAIAETLGRLPANAATARASAERLAPLLTQNTAVRLGALRGLYFLARQAGGAAEVDGAAAAALRALALSADAPRERGLAVATLGAIAAADERTLRAALRDPDPQVRREATAAFRSVRDSALARRLLGPALADPHAAVRHAALVMYAARLADAPDRGCTAVATAARDSSVHVAKAAIQLLGAQCRAAAHVPLLDSIAARTGTGAYDWHRGAQATVALAVTDAERAGARIHALARHPSAFARVYAAHAARHVRDAALLHRLVRDTSANVRTAAVAGLAATIGHAADSVYVAQLATAESELLMAAAAALEGTTHPDALPRLLDALDRVTALQRETSRDARVALLERIEELGSASHSNRIRPYLSDFDHRIVARAARILEQWTGSRVSGVVRPLPRLPLPTYREAAQLARSTFVLVMQDGGEIAIRLMPFDAPTNAARFARLARAGYYDGLTIHRADYNFVVQGGSPGANEYSGDGPYTRDELGEPNWRGTVGLSTRGRDTGDAQFYINLVDNVRLDHEYTVFGVVTRGMDVVDRLREGAVIRRIREAAR